MSKLVHVLITVLTSEKGRKGLLTILGIIFSPVILCLVLVTGSADGASEHNNHMIEVVFFNEPISESVPAEFRTFIENYQNAFDKIDEEISAHSDVEGTFDEAMLKVILYVAYLEQPNNEPLNSLNYKSYIESFIAVSEETIETEITNDDGEKEIVETTIETKKVVSDTGTMLQKASTFLKIDLTSKQEMVNEIYQKVVTGSGVELDEYTPLFSLLADAFEKSESEKFVGGKFGSPFQDDWHDDVTSEFGTRSPIILGDGTVTSSAHTGLDMGKPFGTPILAVADGTVVAVQHTNIGLGIYCVIDHGGGIFTAYGHTSRVLVSEGEKVKKGDTVAEVGSTGYSTGNHLHLEVIEHKKSVNPRKYLE